MYRKFAVVVSLVCILIFSFSVARADTLSDFQTWLQQYYQQLGVPDSQNPVNQLTNVTHQLDTSFDPEYPQPFEEVTFKVVSYSFDLNKSTIALYVNDVLKQTGLGKTTLTFKVGDVGETSTIKAVITDKDGIVVTKSYSVTPALATVVWEADTTTPANYQGKALWSNGSTIRATAFVKALDTNGNPIPSSKLIYVWEQDGDRLPDQSGTGMDHIVISPKTFNQSLTLTVKVSAVVGDTKTQTSSVIAKTDPTIHFYENNTLTGLNLNKDLTNGLGIYSNQSISITAVPFYFSSNTDLSYNWRKNGNYIGVTTPTINLTNESGVSGNIFLQTAVSGPDSIYQTSTGILGVTIYK